MVDDAGIHPALSVISILMGALRPFDIGLKDAET